MRFNVEITFQQKPTTRDSYGQPTGEWPNFLTTLCEMITTGGREFYAAQKVNAETTVLFKMWFEPGIDATMRIKYGDRRFDILSVNNINEQNQFLLISAKEVV